MPILNMTRESIEKGAATRRAYGEARKELAKQILTAHNNFTIADAEGILNHYHHTHHQVLIGDVYLNNYQLPGTHRGLSTVQAILEHFVNAGLLKKYYETGPEYHAFKGSSPNRKRVYYRWVTKPRMVKDRVNLKMLRKTN